MSSKEKGEVFGIPLVSYGQLRSSWPVYSVEGQLFAWKRHESRSRHSSKVDKHIQTTFPWVTIFNTGLHPCCGGNKVHISRTASLGDFTKAQSSRTHVYSNRFNAYSFETDVEEDESVVLNRNAHVGTNNHFHCKALVLLNTVSRGHGSFRCPSDQCPLHRNNGTLPWVETEGPRQAFPLWPFEFSCSTLSGWYLWWCLNKLNVVTQS